MNSHLDEHQTIEANFEAVVALCQTIDAKDKKLLSDLLRLKDQLNQSKIDSEGFSADSTKVSSIMINEIETTQVDYLKREKEDLESRIEQDQKELEKIIKIAAKYQENLSKQSKQEGEAIEMLNLLEEELKSLHDESKQLADELALERKTILKHKVENKKMLQRLFQFDERMSVVTQTAENREKQIATMAEESQEFEARIDATRYKINKVLKMVSSVSKRYKAVKGDQVDELLANVINIKSCDVPISRISEGNYIFGTKKIFCKIKNNNIVVRVGGGFSSMEQFINTYAESERLRL